MTYIDFNEQEQVLDTVQDHDLATEENTSFHSPLSEQLRVASIASDQSELNISIKNGVATLFGTSGSNASSNMVEYLVSRIEEVDTVINLITTDSLDNSAAT